MATPKPTLFGSYAYGWQQYRKYFLYVFLAALIGMIADAPLQGHDYVPGSTLGDGAGFVLINILGTAYFVLIWPIVNFGVSLVVLRFMRDEQADVREVFAGFKTNYLNIVLANLLWCAIFGIGLVLLVIPGIVFACRLAFVSYLVMDKGLDPVAAVEKSWNMTRGHGFRIFGMYLSAIPVAIVGLLMLGVGILVTVPLVSCAFASLYHAIDAEEQRALDENGVAA